jgi:transcriptional regulator with XRE-family HTH domain
MYTAAERSGGHGQVIEFLSGGTHMKAIPRGQATHDGRAIGERLQSLRNRLGISKADLARRVDAAAGKKAAISERTISRWESGKISSRPTTLKLLAAGLGVDIGVLLCEKPIPVGFGAAKANTADARFQVNVRVSRSVRNAYELAAMRHDTSITKIAELAPLLFEILYESSLKHYQNKLVEREDKRAKFDDVDGQFPLGSYIDSQGRDDFVEDMVDILRSRRIFSPYFRDSGPEDWDRDNLFAAYLRGLAEGYDDIEVSAVGPTSIKYRVCRSFAMEWVGNDQEAANRLLSGRVAVDRDFRLLKTSEERARWIRENAIPESEMKGQIFDELVDEESQDDTSSGNSLDDLL